MLRFVDLQNHVLTFLDQAGETGHGLDLVKLAIQSANEKRLTEERWSFMLWPTPQSIQFVIGQKNYVLHSEVQMVTDIWNLTANEPMKETPSRARFKLGVQEDRLHFEFVQNSPVKKQPVEGVVTVSGSARIRYINSDGDVVSEDVSGTSTSGTVSEILNITKLDANALNLTEVGGVNILSLSASEYGKQFPQIRLFDVGQNETGEYRFYKKPSPLVHDNDISDIPYPFSRVLVFDALLELMTYNDSPTPAFWIIQQENWDRQLRQAYQEGEMEGSESRQVVEVDTYEG